MTLDLFRYEFRRVTGFMLTDTVALFRYPRHIELYDFAAEETIGTYRRLDDALDATVGGKTLRAYIEEMEHITFDLDGGRGSGSGLQGFSFGHASRAPGGKSSRDFPARFNVQDVKSPQKTLDTFRDMHVKSQKEHCITVDDQGFCTSYTHGEDTSCAIGNSTGLIIHNHPGEVGGNFSDTDLFSCANGKFSGVIAVGREGTYIFQKTPKFKPQDFSKAVRGAKMHGKDYNEATNRWLRHNQAKYGYVYEFVPAGGAAKDVKL